MTRHPRRRESDLKLWKRIYRKLFFFTEQEHWYRDVWLFVVTAIALAGVAGAVHAVDQVQQGRRIGQGITCAALSAITSTGKEVIQEQGPFARFTLPHRSTLQKKVAMEVGRAYADEIARQMRVSVGPRSKLFARSDGTFNCKVLLSLSNVPQAP